MTAPPGRSLRWWSGSCIPSCTSASWITELGKQPIRRRSLLPCRCDAPTPNLAHPLRAPERAARAREALTSTHPTQHSERRKLMTPLLSSSSSDTLNYNILTPSTRRECWGMPAASCTGSGASGMNIKLCATEDWDFTLSGELQLTAWWAATAWSSTCCVIPSAAKMRRHAATAGGRMVPIPNSAPILIRVVLNQISDTF